MNCHYIVVRETYTDKTCSRTTYGIAAVQKNDGCLSVIQSISDICPEFAAVQQLVQRCNELELELIHLQDVVEDFLIETY